MIELVYLYTAYSFRVYKLSFLHPLLQDRGLRNHFTTEIERTLGNFCIDKLPPSRQLSAKRLRVLLASFGKQKANAATFELIHTLSKESHGKIESSLRRLFVPFKTIDQRAKCVRGTAKEDTGGIVLLPLRRLRNMRRNSNLVSSKKSFCCIDIGRVPAQLLWWTRDWQA